MPWIETILTFVGGGIGIKVLDLVSFRQRDAANMRAELWKEIGGLRESCRQQDIRIAHLQELIDANHSDILNLRAERDIAANLAAEYRRRFRLSMRQVNERDARLSQPPTYDVAAEEEAMRDGQKVDAASTNLVPSGIPNQPFALVIKK